MSKTNLYSALYSKTSPLDIISFDNIGEQSLICSNELWIDFDQFAIFERDNRIKSGSQYHDTLSSTDTVYLYERNVIDLIEFKNVNKRKLKYQKMIHSLRKKERDSKTILSKIYSSSSSKYEKRPRINKYFVVYSSEKSTVGKGFSPIFTFNEYSKMNVAGYSIISDKLFAVKYKIDFEKE